MMVVMGGIRRRVLAAVEVKVEVDQNSSGGKNEDDVLMYRLSRGIKRERRL